MCERQQPIDNAGTAFSNGVCSPPQDKSHPSRRRARLARAAAVFLIPLALSAAGLAAPPLRESDPEPIVVDRSETFRLESKHTGVSYVLSVALPFSYAESDDRYPTLYLLDNHYSLLIARNIVDHMSDRGDLPEIVLVGVGYDGPTQRSSDAYRLNRTRDYTPTYSPRGGYGERYQKVSGGGPRFLDFLAEELVPAIDSRYRTQPGDRALVGHSYGGLFTVYALLTRPQLFRRYIAVSPSLWYEDHWIFGVERELAESKAELPARLYLSVGSREHNASIDMVGDLEELSRRLRASGYSGLQFESQVLDDETHNSVFPRALSNGLRYVFEGR